MGNTGITCGEGCSTRVKAEKPVTIGEYMDNQIEQARKRVEKLCITKAKLEALNVLTHEVDLYSEIIFG